MSKSGTTSEKTMLLADTLSRAYVSDIPGQREPEFETINMLKYWPISEERLPQIQRETENDESLQVLKGWPEQKIGTHCVHVASFIKINGKIYPLNYNKYVDCLSKIL